MAASPRESAGRHVSDVYRAPRWRPGSPPACRALVHLVWADITPSRVTSGYRDITRFHAMALSGYSVAEASKLVRRSPCPRR